MRLEDAAGIFPKLANVIALRVAKQLGTGRGDGATQIGQGLDGAIIARPGGRLWKC